MVPVVGKSYNCTCRIFRVVIDSQSYWLVVIFLFRQWNVKYADSYSKFF